MDQLREVAHIVEEDWPLVVAWMVCAMVDVPTPILLLTGQQGAGKSFAGKHIANTVDPGPACLRAMPKSLDDWAVTAAGSHAFGLDNVSHISKEMSDAMCRAVTGEANVKRSLYTDDDIHANKFKVAILLTSIDPGALESDLGDRLAAVEQGNITVDKRETEKALEQLARELRPAVLGGLLDLVAHVLANPVELKEKPRMADAAEVMASLDALRKTDTLAVYERSRDSITHVVLESDPITSAMLALMEGRAEWTGTATDLLKALEAVAGRESSGRLRNWPANARSLSARAKRAAPALLAGSGLVVEKVRGDQRQFVLRWAAAGDERGSGMKLKT